LNINVNLENKNIYTNKYTNSFLGLAGAQAIAFVPSRGQLSVEPYQKPHSRQPWTCLALKSRRELGKLAA
jgi:hypothetical protein